MSFKIWPPFFAAAPLFGNSASIWHTPLAARENLAEDGAKLEARAEADKDDEERLPERDDAFYWALVHAHL